MFLSLVAEVVSMSAASRLYMLKSDECYHCLWLHLTLSCWWFRYWCNDDCSEAVSIAWQGVVD